MGVVISSFAFAGFGPEDPQNISIVGVVAPNATVEVTIGGDDFPAARRGRCGQDSEGESGDEEYRALLRPESDDGDDGDGGNVCGFCCRCSSLEDKKLVKNIRWMVLRNSLLGGAPKQQKIPENCEPFFIYLSGTVHLRRGCVTCYRCINRSLYTVI